MMECTAFETSTSLALTSTFIATCTGPADLGCVRRGADALLAYFTVLLSLAGPRKAAQASWAAALEL